MASLEAAKKEGESYKVLFLGRHGQGWHNVAETKYGTKAWDVSLPYLLALSLLGSYTSLETCHAKAGSLT